MVNKAPDSSCQMTMKGSGFDTLLRKEIAAKHQRTVIAAKHQRTVPQVVLRWLLQQGITPIAFSRSASQNWLRASEASSFIADQKGHDSFRKQLVHHKRWRYQRCANW